MGRVSGAQMQRQARAVGTLKEQAGVRVNRRYVVGHKC